MKIAECAVDFSFYAYLLFYFMFQFCRISMSGTTLLILQYVGL